MAETTNYLRRPLVWAYHAVEVTRVFTHLKTGEEVHGGSWRRENHGFTSLPLYVRPGAVIAWGARSDRPDYDYLDGLRLRVFPGGEGEASVTVTNPDGRSQTFAVDLSEVTK
ncbi:hypothetical protein [Microbacterium sp. CPCC 204701]|uniref:hypothetical protein n=1 Tax=Microbacterium sp. CPCC 204701 TaxID=2493084 RepID=UPI001F0CDBBB|nr:hypothetical protein [Microbacterium sp. CPCC 204701]